MPEPDLPHDIRACPLIDIDQLELYLRSSMDLPFLERLFSAFEIDAAKIIAALTEDTQALKKPRRLYELAHALKGVSSDACATRLTMIAQHLEDLGHPDAVPADELTRLITALPYVLEKTITEHRSFVAAKRANATYP